MPSLIPDVAAFERRLAGLPVVKHPAHEVVLTAGSKTGRLLIRSKPMVGTTNKSMVAMSGAWFRRKVRHPDLVARIA